MFMLRLSMRSRSTRICAKSSLGRVAGGWPESCVGAIAAGWAFGFAGLDGLGEVWPSSSAVATKTTKASCRISMVSSPNSNHENGRYVRSLSLPIQYDRNIPFRRHSVHRMTLGDFELTVLSDGPYQIDGGAMFGVIPK